MVTACTTECQWLTCDRGGSIVADFLASGNTLLDKDHIIATVRSEEQAKELSKLGINVLQLNLTDEKSVMENVLRYDSMKCLRNRYDACGIY